MATINTLLRIILSVNTATFKNMRIEVDGKGQKVLYVQAKLHKKHTKRCPICGRKCPGYDHSKRMRRWRSLDFGGLIVYIEIETVRVSCPEHGVVTEGVPWAYEGSTFTRDFDLMVAWLATSLSKTAVCELMRIDWKTVGRCISRSLADLEPERKRRLEGLKKIGIDETSYRKGYKYITVIVNHETNCVVWVHDGHGKTVLEKFHDELTEEQRKSIELVTGDGAKWISECVAKEAPDCTRCMDAFHVVQWATEALDAVRIEEWNKEREGARQLEAQYGKPGKGRPAEGDKGKKKVLAAREKAASVKGSSYAVGKAMENLTPKQMEILEQIRRTNHRYYRAYDMKETLRMILKMRDKQEAEICLQKWYWRASHSQIESFKELAKKIKRNWDFILNTIECGLSNARIEEANNKIKLVIRRAYGFRNIDSMINMIYLVCSDIEIPLPNRPISLKESA